MIHVHVEVWAVCELGCTWESGEFCHIRLSETHSPEILILLGCGVSWHLQRSQVTWRGRSPALVYWDDVVEPGPTLKWMHTVSSLAQKWAQEDRVREGDAWCVWQRWLRMEEGCCLDDRALWYYWAAAVCHHTSMHTLWGQISPKYSCCCGDLWFLNVGSVLFQNTLWFKQNGQQVAWTSWFVTSVQGRVSYCPGLPATVLDLVLGVQHPWEPLSLQQTRMAGLDTGCLLG